MRRAARCAGAPGRRSSASSPVHSGHCRGDGPGDQSPQRHHPERDPCHHGETARRIDHRDDRPSGDLRHAQPGGCPRRAGTPVGCSDRSGVIDQRHSARHAGRRLRPLWRPEGANGPLPRLLPLRASDGEHPPGERRPEHGQRWEQEQSRQCKVLHRGCQRRGRPRSSHVTTSSAARSKVECRRSSSARVIGAVMRTSIPAMSCVAWPGRLPPGALRRQRRVLEK